MPPLPALQETCRFADCVPSPRQPASLETGRGPLEVATKGGIARHIHDLVLRKVRRRGQSAPPLLAAAHSNAAAHRPSIPPTSATAHRLGIPPTASAYCSPVRDWAQEESPRRSGAGQEGGRGGFAC